MLLFNGKKVYENYNYFMHRKLIIKDIFFSFLHKITDHQTSKYFIVDVHWYILGISAKMCKSEVILSKVLGILIMLSAKPF